MFWNYLTFKALGIEALTLDTQFGQEYADVTLCLSDGKLPAHKVILAACSPIFRQILTGIKGQQNPFIYLKGIHLEEMKAVLNFMYHGEFNIAKDSLNSVLAVAKGQLILKCPFGVFNSPKKRTETIRIEVKFGLSEKGTNLKKILPLKFDITQ